MLREASLPRWSVLTPRIEKIFWYQGHCEFLLDRPREQGRGQSKTNPLNKSNFELRISNNFVEECPEFKYVDDSQVLAQKIGTLVKTGRKELGLQNIDFLRRRLDQYDTLEHALVALINSCDNNVDLVDIYNKDDGKKPQYYAPRESDLVKRQ